MATQTPLPNDAGFEAIHHTEVFTTFLRTSRPRVILRRRILAPAERLFVTLALASLIACKSSSGTIPPGKPEHRDAPKTCGGAPLTVTFFDAGQALAALVTLPDGQSILVDGGENPSRPGCGTPCKAWNQRVLEGLEQDLGGRPISMLWVTHQHSDHHGGIPSIASRFEIEHYVDNGQTPDKRGVLVARHAVENAGATLSVVQPGSTTIPLTPPDDVTLTAMVPERWPANCSRHPNDCSIGLLIRYCESDILFTGDAESAAEASWDVGDIDLLQVGHHGSATSSSVAFLDRVQPEYAVISCAKPGEGTNRTYCHPREETVRRLAESLGGPTTGTTEAFREGASCRSSDTDDWASIPTPNTLWVTPRDQTTSLQTSGDGSFSRPPSRKPKNSDPMTPTPTQNSNTQSSHK